MEIIDLSQELHMGMPMHHTQPPFRMDIHATHEQWRGDSNPNQQTPAVNILNMSEHTGTHVDALSHMGIRYSNQSIDKMALSNFITRGICLDLSAKGVDELIEVSDLKKAVEKASFEIAKGDTVLIYTDHYRKHYHTEYWPNNPGLSIHACEWLGNQGIAAFGVESMASGVKGVSNKAVHEVCGKMHFTHYENLVNLHLLVGKGSFRFIGLPLKIRGGTGSPVRAVAIFE